MNAQPRGCSALPTRPVIRLPGVAAGAGLCLAAAACGPYYPAPTQPTATQTRAQPRGQTQVQGGVVARAQTRGQLEARLAELERDPARRAEAAAIRARLRDGDFQVGDVVVLRVVGVPQFSDSFPVRAGRMLELPEILPIPLTGVLRTELQSHLRGHVARYVIDPTVEAHSLVRVAVAGAVTRPGFYEVRPDAPLSQAVMSAGGLTPDADATRMSVRRAGQVVIPQASVRSAVAMGATLDDLNIRAGDELRIEERPRRNWLEVARTVAYVAALATGLWAAGRF